MLMLGATSLMHMQDPERTDGGRMVSPVFLTITNVYALPCLSGMERDPIHKERLFGVTGHQGNHGEDVKEFYYYYLDSTPIHTYIKFLYKYPQRRYPYEDLVTENRARSREVAEFEILDGDAFDNDRYRGVFVEVGLQSFWFYLWKRQHEMYNCAPSDFRQNTSVLPPISATCWTHKWIWGRLRGRSSARTSVHRK